MNGPAPFHRFPYPLEVARQLLDGKSLTRTLFNLAIARYSIFGDVLDLGSKSPNASYYQFIQQAPETRVVFTDIIEQPGLVRVDVEKVLPFPDESFDFVLAFHLMEHVYHFENIPLEVFRTLRHGGRAFVSIPFIQEFPPDPDDYFRLSDSALRRVWEEAGFTSSYCEALGEGLLTWVATKLPGLVLPAKIRPFATAVLYLLATPLDRLIAKRPQVAERTVPQRFALEFLAVFEKPAA